jgi:hypothetical protein
MSKQVFLVVFFTLFLSNSIWAAMVEMGVKTYILMF